MKYEIGPVQKELNSTEGRLEGLIKGVVEHRWTQGGHRLNMLKMGGAWEQITLFGTLSFVSYVYTI